MKIRLEKLGDIVEEKEKIIDLDEEGLSFKKTEGPESPPPSEGISIVYGLLETGLDFTFARMGKKLLTTVEKSRLKPLADALEQKYFPDIMASLGVEINFLAVMSIIIVGRMDFNGEKRAQTGEETAANGKSNGN